MRSGKAKDGKSKDENGNGEGRVREAVDNTVSRILDPEEYHHARKKLQRAVLEFYRGLELLNNYRVRGLLKVPVLD
jgi:hypothetical protein